MPPPAPVGFGGQYGYYTDSETGLVLMTHRYYDPGTGRWVTRDPIGYAGGINLYGFVGNNPVMGADPDGLFDIRIGPSDHPWLRFTNESVSRGWRAGLQSGRRVAGPIGYVWGPVGMVGNGADSLLALAQGDRSGAAISASSMIPLGRILGRFKLLRAGTKELSGAAKKALRSQGRALWEAAAGRSAGALRIHHRIPLEWAHLFPGVPPNRLANLVGIDIAAHNVLNAEWAAFKRSLGRRTPRAAEVMGKAIELDEKYGQKMVFPR